MYGRHCKFAISVAVLFVTLGIILTLTHHHHTSSHWCCLWLCKRKIKIFYTILSQNPALVCPKFSMIFWIGIIVAAIEIARGQLMHSPGGITMISVLICSCKYSSVFIIKCKRSCVGRFPVLLESRMVLFDWRSPLSLYLSEIEPVLWIHLID